MMLVHLYTCVYVTLWVYISGGPLVPMLQILNSQLHVVLTLHAKVCLIVLCMTCAITTANIICSLLYN